MEDYRLSNSGCSIFDGRWKEDNGRTDHHDGTRNRAEHIARLRRLAERLNILIWLKPGTTNFIATPLKAWQYKLYGIGFSPIANDEIKQPAFLCCGDLLPWCVSSPTRLNNQSFVVWGHAPRLRIHIYGHRLRRRETTSKIFFHFTRYYSKLLIF